MPTPLTLRNAVSSMELRLRASGNAFYSRQDLIDAFNDGIEELAEATGFCERFGTIPFVSGRRLYDMRTSSLRQPVGTEDDADGFGFTVAEFTRLLAPAIPPARALSRIDGDISISEGIKALSVSFSAAGNNAIGLPWSEYLYPLHCWNPQTSRWLIPVAISDLQRIGGPNWRAITGEPYYYYQQGQWNIGLFPTPNASSNHAVTTNLVVLFFAALPTRLISDMEQVIGLPDEYSLGGEEWGLYDLQCQEAEYKKALRNLGTYNAIEAKLKLAVSRLRLAQSRAFGVQQLPRFGATFPFGNL